MLRLEGVQWLTRALVDRPKGGDENRVLRLGGTQWLRRGLFAKCKGLDQNQLSGLVARSHEIGSEGRVWGCLRRTTLGLRPRNKSLPLKGCSEAKPTIVCTTTNTERSGMQAWNCC